MVRYLAKVNGRNIEYIRVPKRAKLRRVGGGIQAQIGSKVGVVHRGFKQISAPSKSSLLKKLTGKTLMRKR